MSFRLEPTRYIGEPDRHSRDIPKVRTCSGLQTRQFCDREQTGLKILTDVTFQEKHFFLCVYVRPVSA
jgi:hypothetical protein